MFLEAQKPIYQQKKILLSYTLYIIKNICGDFPINISSQKGKKKDKSI